MSVMLKSTYEILEEKVKFLEKKLIEEIPKNLKQTYETGGQWHDNPMWNYSMEDQQRLSRELQKIQSDLINVTFIEEMDIPYDIVAVGTQVRVVDLVTNKEESFKVVTSIDMVYNPTCREGFVSWRAPLIQPLLEKTVGEEVEIEIPAGKRRFKILEIQKLKID